MLVKLLSYLYTFTLIGLHLRRILNIKRFTGLIILFRTTINSFKRLNKY